MDTDNGKAIERMVEQLCSGSFLPDFVVRSPKYRKKSGLEKEAADVLVVFSDLLIAIQVKTRTISQPLEGAVLPEVESNRIARMIAEALQQFRSLSEAKASQDFGSFLSSRGLPLKLPAASLRKVILIVVYGVLKLDGTEIEQNIRCSKSCYFDVQTGMSTHIFSLREFSVLTKALDTLPDFARYLERREFLQESGILDEMADPLDLWAMLTFETEIVKAALATRTPLNIVGALLRHEASVPKLDEQEAPSYLIDWAVHELHAGSGRKLIVDDLGKYEEAPGSFEAYQRIVPFFAQLTRRERAELADALLIRVERSRRGTASYGGLKFSTCSEAYLVYSGHEPRSKRHQVLSALGAALAYHLNVKCVVCIGTGPNGPIEDGCDTLAVQVDEPATEEVRAIARTHFGGRQEKHWF